MDILFIYFSYTFLDMVFICRSMGYKTWFRVLSLAGFAGSNSARGIDVVSCKCGVFQVVSASA